MENEEERINFGEFDNKTETINSQYTCYTTVKGQTVEDSLDSVLLEHTIKMTLKSATNVEDSTPSTGETYRFMCYMQTQIEVLVK